MKIGDEVYFTRERYDRATTRRKKNKLTGLSTPTDEYVIRNHKKPQTIKRVTDNGGTIYYELLDFYGMFMATSFNNSKPIELPEELFEI